VTLTELYEKNTIQDHDKNTKRNSESDARGEAPKEEHGIPTFMDLLMWKTDTDY
jgi:hypothetical protein